ncbi:MAG: sensor histidine kinase [Crocinitomicaceae bacterium]|nr:sensor histidine kinase [Crocinitomicaceae bacterium]
MGFLTPPKTEYKDYFDLARFELTWKTSIFFALLLPILMVVFIFIEQTTIIATSIGWLCSLVFVFLLYRTRKYRLTAMIFAIAGAILCVTTILTIPDGNHFVDPFWMLVITLFTFFTLDKKWGVIIGCINLLGVCYFLIFESYENLHGIIKKGFEIDQRIALSLNICVASTIIGYLIILFIRTKRKAETDLKKVNQVLANQNELISSKNAEKTVMLREIHHRVKNNLQVISSLLRLQANQEDDYTNSVSYQDTINRVSAMALIHEKMYNNDDLATIDLEAYIKNLATEIINSYAVDLPIDYKINSEIETLENKTLVPFALILNELISNSLKHAFTDDSVGYIGIKIKDEGEGKIKLTYKDSGKWQESEAERKSFGLELIDILTQQLDGTKTFSSSPSTSWEFHLKVQ